MRCKACNSPIGPDQKLFRKLPNGDTVMEDLCSRCRPVEEPEDFFLEPDQSNTEKD